jgi:hypothetical protein
VRMGEMQGLFRPNRCCFHGFCKGSSVR